LSILFVILGHLGGTRGFPIGGNHVFLPFLASLGVRVFFVISGYLITRLLFLEQRERGSIYLPTFYFRRAFRILVPYYVFLLGMVFAARMGLVELHPGDLGYALAYLSNYHLHGAWTLAHTWSLAVEEQFYLLWPALLVLLGRRRSLKIAAALLVLGPVARIAVWYLQPALRDGIGHTFGTVADSLAAGCLLAGVSDRLWARPRYRALLGSPWLALLPCALLLLGLIDDRPRIAFTVGAVAINVGVALCVDHCLRFPSSLATRVLSLAPMIAIGRASYSIYLWQQPLLNREAPGLPSSFPLGFIAMAAISTLAYFAVEKPALSARVALEAWLRPLHGRSREAKPAVSAAPLPRAA
jgi:peptidoglycan/LPS O-acetylase OafA/YrhL